MAAVNVSAMATSAVAQVAVVKAGSCDALASKNSMSFSSGRVPSMAVLRVKHVRPVSVRAGVTNDKPDMSPDSPSSTGGITEKAREAAEKTAAVLDGVKEDVEGMLKDNGRDLRSKTGDVVYGAQRNAAGVGNDIVEKTNEAQTKFTKALGKDNKE